MTSADCTLTKERTPQSPRSSSCITSPYSTFDMPAQPYLEAGAEEAQVRHRLDQFARKASGAIALFDDGDEIVFDELAGGVAHQALVVAQQGIEFDEINSAELDGHQLLISVSSLRSVPRSGPGTQGVETLEGNKGCEGSQTGIRLHGHNR